jgi:hypothetical protein
MNRWPVALACWMAVGIACSGPAAPAPPADDFFLQLLGISPTVGTALQKGTLVQVSISVGSRMTSPGRLTLSIRDQAGTALLVPEPSVDIAARGEARLEGAFVVPASASLIQVLVAFRLPGASNNLSALSLNYLTY